MRWSTEGGEDQAPQTTFPIIIAFLHNKRHTPHTMPMAMNQVSEEVRIYLRIHQRGPNSSLRGQFTWITSRSINFYCKPYPPGTGTFYIILEKIQELLPVSPTTQIMFLFHAAPILFAYPWIQFGSLFTHLAHIKFKYILLWIILVGNKVGRHSTLNREEIRVLLS